MENIPEDNSTNNTTPVIGSLTEPSITSILPEKILATAITQSIQAGAERPDPGDDGAHAGTNVHLGGRPVGHEEDPLTEKEKESLEGILNRIRNTK